MFEALSILSAFNYKHYFSERQRQNNYNDTVSFTLSKGSCVAGLFHSLGDFLETQYHVVLPMASWILLQGLCEAVMEQEETSTDM